MDVAYDHIQEETLSPDESSQENNGGQKQPSDLNTEFRDAYRAFSSSPWGMKLGGFFGQVKKQSETLYEGAWQEVNAASSEATKGFTDLRSSILNRTRSLSINHSAHDATASADPTNAENIPGAKIEDKSRSVPVERPESLPADIVKEAESILGRFRVEAAARLKTIQKAEDAADEALLKFGTNIRDFLRDAVKISPPSEEQMAASLQKDSRQGRTIFESKDSEGRPVIHATRFDASLYAIHSRQPSFTSDPPSDEYAVWKETFNVEAQTDAIAKDLEKHEELRVSMEQLVPEKVEYVDFWTRYYFLRHVIETEEKKRRELLKGTQAEEEEVGWGEDESDEEDQPSTPKISNSKISTTTVSEQSDLAKTPTKIIAKSDSSDMLKPAESRRSNEHSVADSDASYDIVSGATSRSPGSPKEDDKKKLRTSHEDSDEEDWE